MKDREPSVTAVMATGHDEERRRMALMTICDFANQTYDKAELLVLNQGSQPLLWNPVKRVREVLCDKNLKVGQLRNMAWDLSDSDALICWDDDDIHHPWRIQYQMANWTGKPRILRRELVLNLKTGEAFKSYRRDGFENSMVWPRFCLARYSGRERSSDTSFRGLLIKELGLEGMDNNPHVYVRCWTGRNLWPWKHFKGLPKEGELEDSEKSYCEGIFHRCQDLVK